MDDRRSDLNKLRDRLGLIGEGGTTEQLADVYNGHVQEYNEVSLTFSILAGQISLDAQMC